MDTPSNDPLQAPHFEVTPFRPDGGAPMLGVLLTVALGVIVAGVLGVAASFIGRWFYLILIFPLAVGGGTGLAVALGLTYGKVRSPSVALLAGLLGGIFGMFTMHYCNYRQFLNTVEQEVPGGVAQLENAGFGFTAFMDARATAGVTIGRGNKGLNIGYVGSIIYWLAEVGIVLWVVGAIAHSSASEPFCTRCNEWKVAQVLYGSLLVSPQAGASAVAEGDAALFIQGSRAPTDVPASAGTCLLKAFVCPKCAANGPVELELVHQTVNAKGETKLKELGKTTYPGSILPVMQALMEDTPDTEEETTPA